MPVLERRPGQSIEIGQGIRITVNEIKGQRVRLYVNAPDDVKVLRTELLAKDRAASAGKAVKP